MSPYYALIHANHAPAEVRNGHVAADESARDRGTIELFYSDCGAGKTFAVAALLDDYAEIEPHYLDLPGHPSPRYVAAGLTGELLSTCD